MEFKLTTTTVVYLIFLATIGFVYNIVAGKFYLIYILLSICAGFIGNKLSNKIPSFLIKLYKKIKKDRITLQYHWYVDFKLIRNYIHISLISLSLCIIITVLVSPVYIMEQEISTMNTYLWYIMFYLHCFVGFSVDSYIIFFENHPAEAPTITF